MGQIVISFLGPPPNDFLTRKALETLGLYLTSSTVAPLNKEYIEIDSPVWYIYNCFRRLSHLPVHSSEISFCEEIHATNTKLGISIISVPTKNLDTFNEKLEASLKLIVENGIDMQRMAMVINRGERKVCGPHSNCNLDASDEIWAAAQRCRGFKRRSLLEGYH